MTRLFVLVILFYCTRIYAQSDTIFVEEVDTIFLETKTIHIDSVIYTYKQRNNLKSNRIFLSTSIGSPRIIDQNPMIRTSYTDSVVSSYSNFINYTNGIVFLHSLNRFKFQFGWDYSYTRFKFSHIDSEGYEYHCFNSIQESQYSALIGYTIYSKNNFVISPFFGAKLARIKKVSGLAFAADKENFREFLSDVAQVKEHAIKTSLKILFEYELKKIVVAIAPEYNNNILALTQESSPIQLKSTNFALNAMLGLKL